MEPRQAATLRDVVDVLEAMYPPATALDWDQVGLVSGDLGQPVRLVHLAVDPTIAVIDEAVAAGADLLVTHHPLLLRGIHSVATTSAKGYAVTRAVRADLALYCAHTNADLATPGVSDALAAACGLAQTEPLDLEGGPRAGPGGRPGRAHEPGCLRRGARGGVAADRGGRPRRRATARPWCSGSPVVGGSGDDRFEAVRRCGADVYVTADLRHHPASGGTRSRPAAGRPYLIDAGHFATEWLWLAGAADRLRHGLAAGATADSTVETYISTLRTDPWDFVVGANADGGATC